jgi:type IV pilus assembly protein PilM
MKGTFGKQHRLNVACELAADRVVAARGAVDGSIDVSSMRALPAGALVPSLTAVNIVDRDIVRRAVQETIAATGGHSRDIIAVVPDGACRVSLLDFDALPEKEEEATAVVRFRLKKSLPFDVEKARVSYGLQAADNGGISVVTAVILHTVLEEYESVLHEAGCTPGIVMPSMLASLRQVDASVPTLVIKIDPVTTSVAIVDRERLVLLRTLENTSGTQPEAAQLAEDAYPSLVFYQDTYGTKVQKILVGGVAAFDSVSAALEEQTGVRPRELVSAAQLGGTSSAQRSSLGGVIGALSC